MNVKVEEELDKLQMKLLCRIKEVENCAARSSQKLDQHSQKLDQHSEKLGYHSKKIESLEEKVRMKQHFEQKENYSAFAKKKGTVYQFVDN